MNAYYTAMTAKPHLGACRFEPGWRSLRCDSNRDSSSDSNSDSGGDSGGDSSSDFSSDSSTGAPNHPSCQGKHAGGPIESPNEGRQRGVQQHDSLADGLSWCGRTCLNADRCATDWVDGSAGYLACSFGGVAEMTPTPQGGLTIRPCAHCEGGAHISRQPLVPSQSAAHPSI